MGARGVSRGDPAVAGRFRQISRAGRTHQFSAGGLRRNGVAQELCLFERFTPVRFAIETALPCDIAIGHEGGNAPVASQRCRVPPAISDCLNERSGILLLKRGV